MKVEVNCIKPIAEELLNVAVKLLQIIDGSEQERLKLLEEVKKSPMKTL